MESCGELERDDAFQRWLPLIYDDLRRVAAASMARRAGKTLQPTAVVHEAYLRLARIEDARLPRNRDHLFATLALAMHQVLASQARARHAAKRGGDAHRTTLGDAQEAIDGRPIDLIDLVDALRELARLNAMHRDVVVLRYIGGMTIEETARALDRSPTTVKDAWAQAKAWLRDRLRGREGTR
ncbi:MAG: ECF-type sigma factor [Planctomycetota bacterium JB042]